MKIIGDTRCHDFKVALVSCVTLPQADYFIGLIKASVTRNRIGKQEMGEKYLPMLLTEWEKCPNFLSDVQLISPQMYQQCAGA